MSRRESWLWFAGWLAALLTLASVRVARGQTPPRLDVVSETVTRVYTIDGRRYTNTFIRGTNAPASPNLGIRVAWEHDPALREFISFKVYARTNLSTNSEVLWGSTTNWFFDYTTSVARPMMFLPRIAAVDVALPKASDGRPK